MSRARKRQYALRTLRAVALGWRDEQDIVIDNDQGESGASAAWRQGFQHLVTDVGMGACGDRDGPRRSHDWQGTMPTGIAWLEICALADTLILRRGWHLHDPANFK